MAIGGGTLVDRAQQVQHLNDAFGTQVKVLANELSQTLIRDHTRAFGVDRDVHGLCHTNGVGHLDLALTRQASCHDVFGDVTRSVGRRAVYFCGIFATECTAAVGAGTAVGVNDDFSAS